LRSFIPYYQSMILTQFWRFNPIRYILIGFYAGFFLFGNSQPVLAQKSQGFNDQMILQINNKDASDTTKINLYINQLESRYANQPDSLIYLGENALHILNIGIRNSNHPESKKNYLKVQSKTYRLLAQASHSIRNTEQVFYLSKLLEIEIKLGRKRKQAEALLAIAEYYNEQDNLPKALENLNETLSIFEVEADSLNMILTQNKIANSYYQFHEYDQALEAYFEVLKIAEESGMQVEMSKAYNSIAHTYLKLGKEDMSIEFFLRSLPLSQEENLIKLVADNYIGIGEVYHQKELYRKAIAYFNKALFYAKANPGKVLQPVILDHMGEVYMDMLKLDSAEILFLTSLELHQQHEDDFGKGNAYFHLAQLEAQKKDTRKAIQQVQQAIYYLSKNGISHERAEAYQLLSNLAASISDFKTAYTALNQYRLFSDSLNKRRYDRSSSYLYLKYEYEKKQAIEKANYRNQISIERERLSFQNKMQLIGIIGTGLIIFLLFYIFFRMVRTAQKKEILSNQKKSLSNSLEKKRAYQENMEKSLLNLRKLQDLISPDSRLFDDFFPDSFELKYHERIPNCSFFWVEKVGPKIYLALGGFKPISLKSALMGSMASELLNHFVLSRKGFSIGTHIQLLQNAFYEKLGRDPFSSIQMKVALLEINLDRVTLAGAGFTAYVLSSGKFEAYTPEDNHPYQFKKPIQSVSTVEFSLKENDQLYMLGSLDEKEFNPKSLFEIIAKQKEKPLVIQRDHLEKHFEDISMYGSIFGFGFRFKQHHLSNR
jgi:tetratricopeptide (TPR) repeat protein